MTEMSRPMLESAKDREIAELRRQVTELEAQLAAAQTFLMSARAVLDAAVEWGSRC